jgi:hypothetical protein
MKASEFGGKQHMTVTPLQYDGNNTGHPCQGSPKTYSSPNMDQNELAPTPVGNCLHVVDDAKCDGLDVVDDAKCDGKSTLLAHLQGIIFLLLVVKGHTC